MASTNLDSRRFQTALREGDLPSLALIPKSDLHIHSILGTRIERVETWVGSPLRRPPSRMSSFHEMVEYAHDVLYPYTLSRAGFEFTAKSAIQDAIDDGVIKLEMSLDVRFMTMYDSVPDGFLAFVDSVKKSTASKIDFRPEVGISKDRDPANEIPLASLCVASGIFLSIDLYGNETAQPPDRYRELYADAKKRGLKLKAHVGEFGDPGLMTRTLDLLQLDEVQHGVAAAGSKPLMERLRRDRIRLNVCPSSNLALGVVSEISHHPIRVLLDHGVRVTINSDDLTIFGQSVSQEYLLLYQSGLLTADELDSIRQEGLSP